MKPLDGLEIFWVFSAKFLCNKSNTAKTNQAASEPMGEVRGHTSSSSNEMVMDSTMIDVLSAQVFLVIYNYLI
jgi:hypothetical protein